MPNTESALLSYLPRKVNSGPWLTARTLYHLRTLPSRTHFLLPICSVDADLSQIKAEPDSLWLPPLFREAMDDELRSQILERILFCFPNYGQPDQNSCRVEVVEPDVPSVAQEPRPGLLGFSVDTAVEEHGPHLPLATDTIQSYSVLSALAKTSSDLNLCLPLEYGQLTWGLPFGFSVDLTAELLTKYLTAYVNCIFERRRPDGIYVVGVHGSIVHREAIVAGLEQSDCSNWAFRWLHEPLAEFASARGDQHAGGVETTLVEKVSPELIDADWFPNREQQIVAGQMTLEKAIELSSDLSAFTHWVTENAANGIVGDIRNYTSLNAEVMFQRMLSTAESDLAALRNNLATDRRTSGQNLW